MLSSVIQIAQTRENQNFKKEEKFTSRRSFTVQFSFLSLKSGHWKAAVGLCCHGFMIFGYWYSTSLHYVVHWELKSSCSSSRHLSGRTTFPRRLFLVLLSFLLRGNTYKALVGHLASLFSITRLSHCCSSQPYAISVKPSAFLDTFSYYILFTSFNSNYTVL